jgi:hypothetical protein
LLTRASHECVYNITDFLKPLGHTGRHCGSGAQRLANAHDIKELAAKHGMDAAKLLGGNVALPPKA